MQLKNGQPTGQFKYRDTSAGIDVRSTSIDSLVVNGNQATFTGSCGPSCQFQVTVTDNGKPGTTDQVSVRIVQNGKTYIAGGTITSGNIQVF